MNFIEVTTRGGNKVLINIKEILDIINTTIVKTFLNVYLNLYLSTR